MKGEGKKGKGEKRRDKQSLATTCTEPPPQGGVARTNIKPLTRAAAPFPPLPSPHFFEFVSAGLKLMEL